MSDFSTIVRSPLSAMPVSHDLALSWRDLAADWRRWSYAERTTATILAVLFLLATSAGLAVAA